MTEPGAATNGRTLLIVGSGLIGTSVGLAASAAGYDVRLADRDADRLRLAVARGAGTAWDGTTRADLAIVAVPPPGVALTVRSLRDANSADTISHVASVQHQPEAEVESAFPGASWFVGSHPVAGSERSGPQHAAADLFLERPWIICPTGSSSPAAVIRVTDLATACGASVTSMPAQEHDALLAKLSHVPQLLASALAATLTGLSAAEASLAGPGLRDTSRLADSDAALWAGIVAGNRTAIREALRDAMRPLEALLDVLDDGDRQAVNDTVTGLLHDGQAGRGKLSGKHGRRPVQWATVGVVVPDEPGNLARLFGTAAAAGVNVEDIRVDHAPGQPLGIVELAVAPDGRRQLEQALAADGWTVTSSRLPYH